MQLPAELGKTEVFPFSEYFERGPKRRYLHTGPYDDDSAATYFRRSATSAGNCVAQLPTLTWTLEWLGIGVPWD